jgi:hypothetical protein
MAFIAIVLSIIILPQQCPNVNKMENRGKIGGAPHICRFGFAWGFVRDSRN